MSVNRTATSLTELPRVQQVIADTAGTQFSVDVATLAQSMVARGGRPAGILCWRRQTHAAADLM